MVYFIHGKAKHLIVDLRRPSLLAKSEKTRHSIITDIHRTLFLGTRNELHAHLKHWQDESIPNHLFYWQGDMSAGNIHMLFPERAFRKAEESDELLSETYYKQKKAVSFAYVDKAGVPSGFGFCYRADDPSLWLIAITKNTHLPVEQREVYVVTSFNPEPYLVEPEKRLTSVSSHMLFPITRTISNHINSPCIEAMARSLVSGFNTFNVNAGTFMHCAQYVTSETSRFEDNDALLQLLEKNPEIIINDPLLQKLNSVGSHLTPRQVIDCLKPQSSLNKVLLSILDKKTITLDDREKAYVALRLDKLGLLEQYGWVADSDALLAFVKSLLNEFDDRLIEHFTTQKQVDFFRFLNHSPYKMEMARLLITQKGKSVPVVWKAVEFFHNVFLKQDDQYIQAVVFQLLLIEPELTPSQLTQLIDSLTPSKFLAQVFNPLELASYLAKQQPSDRQVERIKEMQGYFANVLPKFETAQLLRKKPLQPDFLKGLGKRYIDGQDLHILAICENDNQIKACQILLELDFPPEILAFTVPNDALVLAINQLDALNLKAAIRPLLNTPLFHVVLPAMSTWPLLQQRALWIFVAQKLIKIEEIDGLRQRLVAEPYLANLILVMHEEKFTPSTIRDISSNPVKSRALSLLMTLKLSFDHTVLDSPLCHLLSLLHSQCESSLYKDGVRDYIAVVLPVLLKHQFPAPVDKPDTVRSLSQIISDYQLVASLASALGADSAWLDLLKKKPRLQAMAVALRQLDIGSKEVEITPTLASQLFSEFASYFAMLDDKPGDELIQKAVAALIIIQVDDKDSPVTNYFPALITKPQLAEAVLTVHKQNLPVRSLLQEENQASRVALVNRLACRGSTNAAHYELAMENDEEGYDFRKIMDKVKHFPPLLQPDAAQFVYEGITQRQTGGFFKPGQEGQALAGDDTWEYGNYLAMRVLLVNRFRQLGLDRSLVDLLLEENEKGRQFFTLVTQIETRFQNIRARLSRHAPDKLARYLEPERQYRTQLYQMVFGAMNQERRPDKDTFLKQLKQVETPLMAIANEDRNPRLRKTLMIIANMVTLIFTLTLANAYHYRKSGDFLFFERPATSEGINTLDIELARTIGAPAA
ncbi:hypothetical protein DIZ81_02460 [Legionella taurinensis]|uniref:Uncharacterized protein n=1 Tax=Legionella taurinensis TaxID=70611 RepID=A0AB38N8W4_9GAMM|nr:hypothetical protein [Legionella taurinensis]MDX1836265.1 hypothetical protein [Legionella taurinensis]PUT41977.1 hypothetical protein DB744_02465 [Legionella taurinensis]PUT44766.1 hypothetical protein DB746_02465 [Legionella taurinensis]PUT48086.1 hypothetical protein DB743_00625 [Legionella taurinensis]PUT48901.1 hypothetical protein DB745_02465 [Legionella taurinensis]